MVLTFSAVPLLLACETTQAVGFALSAAGYAVFDIMIWLVLSEVAYGRMESSVRVIGFGWAVSFAGHVTGILSCLILQNVQLEERMLLTISIMAIYLLVIGAVLILLDDSGLWTLLKYGTAFVNPPEKKPMDAKELAIRRFAGTNQLTSRETDVLLLLCSGMTASGIANRLFISEYTVKDHIKRIYAKCQVHGKQALLDLIESDMSSD